MIPSRSRWEPYLPLATAMYNRYGVPIALILATMYAESNFDPRAFRDEPQIGDASRGLMQLLLKTARGLGFSGHPDQLYDPATNADLGTKLLWQNIRARGGNLAAAVSMYNGGYRPSLGFGAPLANGKFKNQAYVDKVLGAKAEFERALAVPPPPSTPSDPATGSPGPGPTDPTAPSGDTPAWAIFAVAGALIAGALAMLLKR